MVSSSKEGIYLTRHIGLRVGVPHSVGALTVNRLCGSGFQVIRKYFYLKNKLLKQYFSTRLQPYLLLFHQAPIYIFEYANFQALVSASHQIALGESSLVLAGGAENMSQVQFLVFHNSFFRTLFYTVVN